MRVVILVPRRAGAVDRDRLWAFCRPWWERDHPDWPMIVGGDDATGPFNRARALNEAARAAGDWDAAVIIDADVLVNGDLVRQAVARTMETSGPVLAYRQNVRLTPAGTRRILGGYRGDWSAPGFVKAVHTEFCSCAVAVTRPLWDAVGGFDERFVGWGYEDTAFRFACETAAGRELERIDGKLYHLFHRPAPDARRGSETLEANKARCAQYRAARFDREAMTAVLDGSAPPARGPEEIPKILHRTIPAKASTQVERWWRQAQRLHPEWEHRTYRDPLDPKDWPMTAQAWQYCTSGAQLAGLIRLEALVTHGGVYIDSDVELYRNLDPLLGARAFAGWEDARVVPDAVLGCRPGHPAFEGMVVEACNRVLAGAGAWDSGPGVTTKFLVGQADVLLLPPGSFYPVHYKEKERCADPRIAAENPWAFGVHHWHGSWLPK